MNMYKVNLQVTIDDKTEASSVVVGADSSEQAETLGVNVMKAQLDSMGFAYDDVVVTSVEEMGS